MQSLEESQKIHILSVNLVRTQEKAGEKKTWKTCQPYISSMTQTKLYTSSESLAQAGSPKVSAVVKLFFCGHCATTLLLVFKGTKAGKLAAVSLKKMCSQGTAAHGLNIWLNYMK